MTPNSMIKKLNSIFEQANGADIDWSARESYLAAYITSGHLEIDLCYDFSPATDDSQLAADFWAVYDAIYRSMLTMIDLGSWARVREALARGQFDDVDGDIAYGAIQTALRS